ncbi:MAG: hypothetical protein IPH07_01405 [Deltaproteobacteria bacterium]|nr:hypothetical protein [Deltaproteobacteria bacterium]MBK8720204.1 hypothetical protein [Deltaproteobacteria bacterium]MBP7286049.1 hypothetical protein [Nannocystaceae bacterium]
MRNAPLVALLAYTLAWPTSVRADDPPERVTMKLEEFLKLYESTRKRDEEPPREGALASARYRGEVVFEDGKPSAAVFRAKQHIEVLRTRGWARIPLLPATVALQSAKIGGKEAPVVIEGGFYTLVTDRRGAFDLDLQFGVAVGTSEGQSSLSFQLAPSGATEVELAVPAKEDLDFSVIGAQLSSDKVVGGNRVVEATLPATGSLTVQWQREIPEAEKKSARVYAEVQALVSLGEGVLRSTTTIQHTILFAGVDKFAYEVPKGMTVLDVRGTSIRDWKLGEDGKLDVVLNFAAEGSYTLVVELERAMPDDAKDLAIPVVSPIGAERAKGYVGIESRGNLEIASGTVEGATPVDVRALPAAILGVTDQPLLFGFKYVGAHPQIGVATGSHADVEVLVTLLDQTRATTMWTREGRRLTSVSYQVRNNRRQFLKLALPEGAELWSASVGGRGVQPAKASDGRVMVPLLRSQDQGGELSAFAVQVVYVDSGEPTDDSGRGTFHAKLPVADVPSTYVSWEVYSPEGTKVARRSHEGTLRHVKDLSNPIPTSQVVVQVPADAPAMAQPPQQQRDFANEFGASPPTGGAAMGQGATPVQVSLPLSGESTYYEKLLAFGEKEQLEVSFRYRGLRKK